MYRTSQIVQMRWQQLKHVPWHKLRILLDLEFGPVTEGKTNFALILGISDSQVSIFACPLSRRLGSEMGVHTGRAVLLHPSGLPERPPGAAAPPKAEQASSAG